MTADNNPFFINISIVKNPIVKNSYDDVKAAAENLNNQSIFPNTSAKLQTEETNPTEAASQFLELVSPTENDNNKDKKYVSLGSETIELNIDNTPKIYGEGYEIGVHNNVITRTIGSLFYDSESKDGIINDTKQGLATGDCWLLSGVNALSYSSKGAEYIKDALEYQDGCTIVHLKGGAGDYVVTDEELMAIRADNQYSGNDIDMVIFELAVEKYRDDLTNNNVYYDTTVDSYTSDLPDEETSAGYHLSSEGKTSITGGHSNQMLYLLTGKPVETITDKDQYEEYLNKLQNGECAITVSTGSKAYDTDNNEIYDGDGSHAFAVKSFDGENVTIINPWDSSKEHTISLEELKSKFYHMGYIDLSDENPETELISRNDNITTKLDNTEYKVKVLSQTDGDITDGVILDNNSNYGIQFNNDGTFYAVSYNDKTKNYDKMFEINQDEYKDILKDGLKDYVESQRVEEKDDFGNNSEYIIADGQKLPVETITQDGSKIEYKYDSQNRCLEKTTTNADGTVYKEANEYGDTGKLLLSKKYILDENNNYRLYSTTSDYKYETIAKEDVIVSQRVNIEGSNAYSEETYEYDVVDKKPTKTKTTIQEYGQWGLLGGVQKTTEIRTSSTFGTENVYENGKLVLEKSYDKKSGTFTEKKYEDTKLISETTVDPEGNKQITKGNDSVKYFASGDVEYEEYNVGIVRKAVCRDGSYTEYDYSNGMRSERKYQNNQLVSDTKIYPDGNRAIRTYDEEGNLLSTITTSETNDVAEAEWNSESQPVRIVYRNGNYSLFEYNGDEKTVITYNSDNNIIEKSKEKIQQ